MKRLFILSFGIALLTTACRHEPHFLTDTAYRTQVHAQFLQRKTEAAGRHQALFAVLDSNTLNTEQREALEFLYAGLPLCDLSEYDSDFFLQQIDAAFAARNYFPWGKTIPEDIFRHFVLVPRASSEYLDSSRVVFFETLKERVRGLSMYDAVLEVNHWCHEKVTYRGTDSRTAAPLDVIRTAWGRCGEEAVLTTTALRAVGIPARQCYTPRWVHTDDNHAWVEAWVDGTWYYLGACEPEAELNMAWFTAPVRRAMMVNTIVIGDYRGAEEKNTATPLYARINILENYAPTRTVRVQVTDTAGVPAAGASVKFNVYNYARLYPLAENTTAADGTTALTSGRGDLLIWAAKDHRYGYARSTPDDTSGVLTVRLDRTAGETCDETFVMNAPVEQKIALPSSDKLAANAARLLYEDSLRNAYMSTFITPSAAQEWAQQHSLPADPVWKYLHAAQGNWQEIATFMAANRSHRYLFPFLASLSDKDLRDTPAAFLNDHLQAAPAVPAHVPDELVAPCILSPRIEAEWIRPWRSFLRQPAVIDTIAGRPADPQHIIRYIKHTIALCPDANYVSCPQTPQGVYELKLADVRSRNIFFVAVCRTAGIPARIETATGKPQYFAGHSWHDAVFETDNSSHPPKGQLVLLNDPQNILRPNYNTHYTLSVFRHGDFYPLDFRGNPAVEKFPCTLTLDAGYYRLLTGSRAHDGSVTVGTEYFTLRPGKIHTTVVTLPPIDRKIAVRGSLDMNTILPLSPTGHTTLKALANGRGLLICFIDPHKEPSKHVLQDLPAHREAFEKWGGGMLLLTPSDKAGSAFDPAAFGPLPQQITWATDADRTLLHTVTEALQMDFADHFPLTVYLTHNGGILYVSEGYRLGIGGDVLEMIRLSEVKVQN